MISFALSLACFAAVALPLLGFLAFGLRGWRLVLFVVGASALVFVGACAGWSLFLLGAAARSPPTHPHPHFFFPFFFLFGGVTSLRLGGGDKKRPGGAGGDAAVSFAAPSALVLWNRWLSSRALSPRTIRNYIGWGERMARRWDVISATTFPACVEIASASLRRQAYSATTIHGFQCSMASLAQCLWGWDAEQRKTLITARPVKHVHAVPDSSEVAEFIRKMPSAYRSIGLLCYCCGLRISEAANLQLAELNTNSHMLTIAQGKGAKGRVIPIPPEIISDLRKHAAHALEIFQQDTAQGNVSGPFAAYATVRIQKQVTDPGRWPLFPQKKLVWEPRFNFYVRVPEHTSRIEKAFKQTRMKSGVVTRITPHRLRDAFAVHSLIAGVPVNVIQKHMGHATIETTAKYLSFLLTDEGAKLFPGINLFKNTFTNTNEKET